MADLYSVIEGLEPTQQDVLEAELLARQILEANFPDMDLREGTGIRDLVLRPSAFLLALCKKGFDYHFAQNTLAGIDDSSPTEIVDGLLGNLFLTRNLGVEAIINVRLYFSRQKSVFLSSSTSFSTDNTLNFYPIGDVTYPESAMSYDASQNEWYLDVDLIASQSGEEFNISSGSLLYFGNFDPYFLHGEINFLSQTSTTPETNSEFIARAETGISTRNLINKPSIANRILQTFNAISHVVTVGANDEEQHRDLVEVRGTVGLATLGNSLTLSDSNTKLQIGLPNHGFVVGTLVNIVESSALIPLVIKSAAVSDVLDSATFKVIPQVTIAPRSFNAPIVAKVEEDIFVHAGGKADVHCSRDVVTDLSQYTLDSTGKCQVFGPVFQLTQSEDSGGANPDTVTPASPFTVTFPGHAQRADITLTYNSGALNVTLAANAHCFTLGRYVTVSGWPTAGSVLTLPVTQVVDQDTVVLGRNFTLPAPVAGGLIPTVKYVYPTQDVGFSTDQALTVDFGVGNAGGLVSLNARHFEHLSSVQAYLRTDDVKVICADYLARGFDIFVLDFDIKVYDTTAPSTAELGVIIDGFLSSLAPGEDFILSDLVADITAKGISRLRTPLEVGYSLFTKDMLAPVTGTVTDKIRSENSVTVFVLGNVTTGIVSL